jgi:site-specific DNA-methyltransferase (adenine-specific)/modification methylase
VSGVRCESFGTTKLMLGDSRELVSELAGIGAILTDPPFGKSYRSRHNDGRGRSRPEWARKDGNFRAIEGDDTPFNPAFLLELAVPTIIWGANYFNDRLPPATRWLVWDKLAGKTPARSSSDIELAWCSSPGVDRIFTHLWRGIIRAGEENVTNGPKLHPHQKPVALMAWCLELLPKRGAVLDPFMGSGSAGVACLRANRPFIGIEMDVEHFDTACRRFEREMVKLTAAA